MFIILTPHKGKTTRAVCKDAIKYLLKDKTGERIKETQSSQCKVSEFQEYIKVLATRQNLKDIVPDIFVSDDFTLRLRDFDRSSDKPSTTAMTILSLKARCSCWTPITETRQ